MVLKTKNAYPSVVNGGGFQRTSTEPVDHWDFLDEIDAPMWVDLTLESKSMDQDIDDAWFQVPHPFHQCSSRHLISEFSVSGEGKENSVTDFLGPSPKLPPSVSRSRGKHYRRRKCGGGDHVISVDKQHPIRILGGKTLRAVSGSGQEAKPKTSFGNRKRTSSLKPSPFHESRSIETIKITSTETKPSFGNPKCTSSLKGTFVGESSSTDIIRPNPRRTKPSSGDSESTLSFDVSFVGESNSASFGNTKYTSSLKGSLVHESSSSDIMRPNPCQTKSSLGDSESTLSFNASFVGESNSASTNRSDSPKPKSSFGDSKSSSNSKATIVAERNQQQPAVSEVSHEIFGRTSGFLSAVRISLRKSCVTRQASRVEVKDGRQSKGRKSSSSKSSVGSSSNSGCDLKNTMLKATVNKNRTPESRKVVRKVQPTNHNKGKGSNVCKTFTGRFLDLKSNSRQEEKAISVGSVCQGISKSKVLYQTQPRKPTWQRNVQNPFNVDSKAKENVADGSKVNAVRRTVSSQKASGKENAVGRMFQSQKASKHNSEVKDKKGLSDPKEKANGRNQGNNPKNVVQRIYFR